MNYELVDGLCWVALAACVLFLTYRLSHLEQDIELLRMTAAVPAIERPT